MNSEERPYKTGDKVWYLNELYTLEDDSKHYILTSVRNNAIVHLDYGNEDFKLLPYKEPVSEDLEEATISYAATSEFLDNGKEMIDFQKEKSFKAGAQWKEKRIIEKNNLIHDIREGWTDEEWNAYYQTLAEANEEEKENLT